MRIYLLIAFSFLFLANVNGQKIKKTSAKDAIAIVSRRDTVRTALIDGRKAEMFAEKHIKGAINIDAFKASLDSKLKAYLTKEKIIVYCSNYRRAETIVNKLEELQYSGQIVYITDGINGWISAKHPTVSNKKPNHE